MGKDLIPTPDIVGYLDAGPVTPSSHVTGGDPGVTAPQPAPGTHHRSRDGSRAASRARPALHRAPRSPYGPPSAAAAQRTGRTAWECGARVAVERTPSAA